MVVRDYDVWVALNGVVHVQDAALPAFDLTAIPAEMDCSDFALRKRLSASSEQEARMIYDRDSKEISGKK